jgi:hypothetical protein
VERIPTQVSELPADALAQGTKMSSVGNKVARPQCGARIANARGVPGTLGCVARTRHDGQPVLLSTGHVLFGNGARKGDAIWSITETDGQQTFQALGQTLYGKIGSLHFREEEFYIDCAVGSCTSLAPVFAERSSPETTAVPFVTGHDAARVGSHVRKTGAATGITSGIIVDINYSTLADAGGSRNVAMKQILVRPTNGHAVFSAEGDSGALILDESNRAVGLLWGTNTRGEGVACAIEPVLYALNIVLGD